MARFRSKTGRQWLLSALFAGAAALSGVLPADALAAPPAKQTTQVPGYYRINIGDIEVTALYDGYVALDTKLLKGASANDIQSLLARMFVASGNGVQTAVNAFLINTGKNLILVDTGAARCFGPTLGVIPDNLRAAGYDKAQVDTVLLTHLHGDHACGLLAAEGRPAFPNATIYAAEDEAAFWLGKDNAAKAPKEVQPFFKMAQDAIEPYVAAGKFKQFNPGDTILPGVVSVPAQGHTPGHAGYMFGPGEGEDQLLVWGDIVHSHAVQFVRPEVAIEFDVDSKKAIATRKSLLAQAAKKKLWVAGAHLPFPGIGHVRSERKGYSWVPVEYSPLQQK
ncbi:MBL fold metallo-hydrolase [Noviherbaspirillum sp. CPCC 100848]|uniref:MBL fold metallo-hydrolase n=1 Tax=Noviherbaspirillum album TaxID=3080276 RepID=A0ABU6J4Y7_9BURK|nr:MBL fold metallo-hydrolase [Noviherbaspirillum sp. CPCC 100848]MEC4718518.1 MBL fold metallo-hydrolase [Noviherbaspirillum sp. CPCC 100848]